MAIMHSNITVGRKSCLCQEAEAGRDFAKDDQLKLYGGHYVEYTECQQSMIDRTIHIQACA